VHTFNFILLFFDVAMTHYRYNCDNSCDFCTKWCDCVQCQHRIV